MSGPVKNIPSDAIILEAVRDWGGRGATYVIKNRLQMKGYPVKTPWVLRQLKRLQAEGLVHTVPSSYAVMLTWTLTPTEEPQP